MNHIKGRVVVFLLEKFAFITKVSCECNVSDRVLFQKCYYESAYDFPVFQTQMIFNAIKCRCIIVTFKQTHSSLRVLTGVLMYGGTMRCPKKHVKDVFFT